MRKLRLGSVAEISVSCDTEGCSEPPLYATVWLGNGDLWFTFCCHEHRKGLGSILLLEEEDDD